MSVLAPKTIEQSHTLLFFRDLFRAVFVWKIPQATWDDIAGADVIVTMAYGLLKNGKPSPGDRVLARVVRELHDQFPNKPR